MRSARLPSGRMNGPNTKDEPAGTAAHDAPGRLPDFVIVGAQKSGTSSLRWWLTRHPEAWCAQEPHFFCHNFERGVDWYRSQLIARGTPRLIGDKTPDYMHAPHAIDRMADLLPDARLIAILRDPVARAYSHYWHNRREGHETLDFSDALAAEPERLDRSEIRLGYVDRSLYLRQLQSICARYPRDSLLVLLFEDLEDQPESTFRAVCRFLGLDPAIMPDVVGQTRNAFYQQSRLGLRRRFFSSRLAQRLPRRLAGRVARMEEAAQYDPMDEPIRRRLAERFAPENESLAAWLGLDLSRWTMP